MIGILEQIQSRPEPTKAQLRKNIKLILGVSNREANKIMRAMVKKYKQL